MSDRNRQEKQVVDGQNNRQKKKQKNDGAEYHGSLLVEPVPVGEMVARYGDLWVFALDGFGGESEGDI